jgi:hypothetical protein
VYSEGVHPAKIVSGPERIIHAYFGAAFFFEGTFEREASGRACKSIQQIGLHPIALSKNTAFKRISATQLQHRVKVVFQSQQELVFGKAVGGKVKGGG